jgi:hypothetical protein
VKNKGGSLEVVVVLYSSVSGIISNDYYYSISSYML